MNRVDGLACRRKVVGRHDQLVSWSKSNTKWLLSSGLDRVNGLANSVLHTALSQVQLKQPDGAEGQGSGFS